MNRPLIVVLLCLACALAGCLPGGQYDSFHWNILRISQMSLDE